MGQAETDGPDRPGWRGDRWQHGTARKGGHMATWDWQEHRSLRWAQLQPGESGFAWEKVKGLSHLSIPPQTWAGTQ